MSWSDILGAIGAVAGGASGLLGGAGGIAGDIGKIAGGIGTVANLGGSILATQKAAGQADQATQGTTRALSGALSLAQQKAKEEAQTFSKAMGLIPGETDAYNKALASLGPMPAAPMFDPNTVETRAQQLLPEYMQQADQDIQRGFSSDMGRLMQSGIDDSTYGIQARAAEGTTAANVHRTAYNKAYTDAITYATNIYDEQYKSHQGAVTDRATALSEAMDPYKNALTAYMDLYGKTSGGDTALNTAGNLADNLSKAAAVGSNAAQTGAASSATKQGLTNAWSGITDLFGNPFGSTPSNSGATDPYAYIGSGGTSTYTLQSGADY